MSIELHCDHCSKLIRAPDDAAGRRGKCPYCHQSVYIPSPPEAIEEIPLSPMDESDEEKQRRLTEEMRRTQRELLSDYRPPPDRAVSVSRESAMPETIRDGDESIEDMVVDYLLLMRESQLVEAEAVLADLLNRRDAARKVVDRLSTDTVPPQALAGIPAAVYRGFLKNLRNQLK